MTPIIAVELAETRSSARRFERGYRQLERELTNLNIYTHGAKSNERPLASRNKREGWYTARVRKFRGGRYCLRGFDKELALRYRKQSGTQLMFIKPRTEREMSAIGARMVSK